MSGGLAPAAGPSHVQGESRDRRIRALSTSSLPSLSLEPRDPLASPASYDGVLSRRFIAFLIDFVIIGLVWSVAAVVLILAGLLTFGLLFPLVSVGLALVPILYDVLTIGGPQSATPGMRLFGLEVRNWNGARPGYLQALLMSVLFYTIVISVFGWLTLGVAFFNSRSRTLHDYLSGVVVLRRP